MIKGGLDEDWDRRSAPRRRLGPEIDRLSKAIIERLQVDGRQPFAEIAEDLGVSEETVSQRVSDLTESGLIQITAVSDPLKLGFARQAMLGITVEGASAKTVAERLSEISEVVYVVLTAGGFDILAEVVGGSDAQLLELVTTRIKPVEGVAKIHTFLYLELQKQTYTWGVR